MKVNDYVRIKNKAGWCCIGQIHNINEFREPSTKYCVDIQGNDYIFIGEDIIEKSSSNIIDLIEVGDIVVIINGLNEEELILIKDLKREKPILESHKIKSILTKEQFEGMEYKVGKR